MRQLFFIVPLMAGIACSQESPRTEVTPRPAPQNEEQTEKDKPIGENPPPGDTVVIRNEITQDKESFVIDTTYSANPDLWESLINLWPFTIKPIAPKTPPVGPEKKANSFNDDSSPEQDDTNTILMDLAECGFSYDGPECSEGQIPTSEIKELVYVDQVPYLFVVTSYQPLTHKIAYFYRLQSKDNVWTADTVYPFLITDSVWSHDVGKILREEVAIALAKVSFTRLNVESALAQADQAISGRALIYLAQWIDQRKASMPPLEQGKILQQLGQIMVNQSQKVHDDTRVDIANRFLQQMAKIVAVEDFTAALNQFITLDSPLAQESAVILFPDHQDNIRILNLFSSILNESQTGTLKRALTAVVTNHYVFTERRDIYNLIVHLDHPEDEVIELTYKATIPVTLTPEFSARLIKYILTAGHKELTVIHALDLLIPLGEMKLKGAYIAHLSNPSPIIRDRVFQALDKLVVNNEDLTSLEPHFSSSYPDTRRFVVHLADRINSTAANDMLIHYLPESDPDIRSFMIGILTQKSLIKEQIPALEIHFPSVFADLRLAVVQLLFQMNSLDSLKSLINHCDHEDGAVRTAIINGFLNRNMDDTYADLIGAHVKSVYIDVSTAMAYMLIQNRSTKSSTNLITIMDVTFPTVRAAIFSELITRTMDSPLMRPLKTKLNHVEAAIRIQTAQLLGNSMLAEALTALKNRLNIETDAAVKVAIKKAMDKISPP